jgi:hypothetical protein
MILEPLNKFPPHPHTSGRGAVDPVRGAARWVMARDVTLAVEPPEIHGEEVLSYTWIVLIDLRGLLRSFASNATG